MNKKEISADTLNVIGTLESYSKKGLRKKNDLAYLLEFCASTSDYDTMQALLLHGSALRNLSSKLAEGNLPEDALNLVQNEFSEQLQKISAVIQTIVDVNWDQQHSLRLTEIYLEQTKGSVMNILDLSSDLHLFKKMQSEHRQTRSSS